MAIIFLWVLILTVICMYALGKISTLSDKVNRLENLMQKAAPEPAKYVVQPEPVKAEATAVAKVEEAVTRLTLEEQKPAIAQPPMPIAEEKPTAVESVKEQRNPQSGGTIDAIAKFVKGGNIWVAVGVMFVVLSLAFAYRYISLHYHIPSELKVSFGLLFGFALFIFGWLKRQRKIFAQIMQGGGIGAIYLSLYAACKYYGIISETPIFLAMTVLVFLAGVIAVLEDSQPMAFFAALLGFITPLILSTGENNYIALFTLYSLINIGILLCALKKYWRWLNGMAFAFTQIVWLVWLSDYYYSELFVHTELYLVGFFLIFTAINIINAKRMIGIKTENVFAVATPFVFMLFQLRITNDFEYGNSIAAFALGLLYLLLAFVLYKKFRIALRQLFTLYLSFGIIFLNLAVPLAIPGEWTAGIWAVEGAMLVVLGTIQNIRFFRWFGAMLIFGAFIHSVVYTHRAYFVTTFLNTAFVCRILVACAMLVAAFAQYKRGLKAQSALTKVESAIMSKVFLGFGLLIWYVYFFYEASYQETLPNNYTVYFLVLVLSALILSVAGRVGRWRLPQYLAYTPLLLVFFSLLMDMTILGMLNNAGYLLGSLYNFHIIVWIFEGMHWIAWLVFIAINIYFLHHYTVKNQLINKHVAGICHAIFLFVLAVLFGTNIGYVVYEQLGLQLYGAPHVLLMSFIIIAVLSARVQRFSAVELYSTGYRLFGIGFLVLYIARLEIRLGFYNVQAEELATLPFLNTIDMPAVLAFTVIIYWFLWLKKHYTMPKFLARIGSFGIGGLIFYWMHCALGRMVLWFDWHADYYNRSWLFESAVYQLTISILWGVVGFVLMILGHKFRKRAYWLTGAILLGCDAIKLLLVDLSNAGTLARIGSFMGVGLIMIVIGYFIPLPPREDKGEN